jgi:hypothetical protein
MSERKRLQIDLAPEAVRELRDLQEKTGLSTRADVIRHALRFLQWTVDELVDQDADLVLRKKDGEMYTIALPFWPMRRSSRASSQLPVHSTRESAGNRQTPQSGAHRSSDKPAPAVAG